MGYYSTFKLTVTGNKEKTREEHVVGLSEYVYGSFAGSDMTFESGD